MRAVLIRVGIDQAYGQWNAPVDPDTLEFVYVPIPDGHEMGAGLATPYSRVGDALAAFARERVVDDRACALPADLLGQNMHLDPDFRWLTYGNNANTRGSIIGQLAAGDLAVFYAGLRPCRPGGDHANPRPSSGKLLYALTGLYRVAEVVRASGVEELRRNENAHTRRRVPTAEDVIVRAAPGTSGRLRRCLPIGDFRERAYRVFPDLLATWGDLSCRDGYLQRSGVPPTFRAPDRFLAWFDAQHPELVQDNN
ncbi:MAG: hypothetical protein HS111_04615 [Kofleriaceae bacterium]|nr:hypothetical protein [Kofleriaceae bacterium]MCL4228382.1 hypothetical protein [Myxococcales bacterium]